MGHAVLSVFCFVLWAFTFNLMFYGMVLAMRRVGGSALLFSSGTACLVLLLSLAVYAHVDIARPSLFGSAAMTCPLFIPLLTRRLGCQDGQAAAKSGLN